MRFRDVGAADALDGDAVAERLGAFLAHRLALARGEGGEEIVEGGVAVVVPVKLLIGALEEAGVAERLPLAFVEEGDVQRGGAEALRDLDGRCREQPLALLGAGARAA